MRILVTGGAGFIGSHLVKKLTKKNEVVVFDNLSSGRRSFLKAAGAEVVRGDIRNASKIRDACRQINAVYHLAADADVRRSTSNPIENFGIDALGTVNVLEACRLNGVGHFVFASSSVVYGNAEMPTPEEAPLAPISNYAAAKVASECYTMTYSQLYDMRATILRYANIIGPRLNHGVIYDFYSKLRKNSDELEILGDGNQDKSYLHVEDAVDATLLAVRKTEKCQVFNVGSGETITVKEIARILASTLGLGNVKYVFTGGRTGWPGDVPVMFLSVKKLKGLGWKPRFTTEQSVVDTVNWLRKELR